MFLFKKIFSAFLFPLSISLFFLSVGVFLLWFRKKEKIGKIFVTISLMLFLFITNKTSNLLLKPLESKYPPYSQVCEASVKPEFVVILGGGHTSDPNIPFVSQLESASLFRLIEGIRIYRLIPGSKMILSGGGVFDSGSEAEIMFQVAKSIGVEEKDMILESKSKDTEEQAILLKPILNNRPIILVTSASHIPRSISLFKKLGMNPIPAPTEYLTKENKFISPGLFFPSANNIDKSQRAVYEYMGICWAKIRGKI